MTAETIELAAVSLFPTDVRHPETGEWIRIVGYTQPHDYLSGVYAYVDPETGEYGGMLLAHDGLEDTSPTVETRERGASA
jgi:hypothetical protein